MPADLHDVRAPPVALSPELYQPQNPHHASTPVEEQTQKYPFGACTPNLEPVPPWADTTTPSGKMVMTIFGGIAEFERTLILSRTQDGRQAAQARGVTFGRPQKMTTDQKDLARELVREGKSISAVARTFKVHPATIYRCLDEKSAL